MTQRILRQVGSLKFIEHENEPMMPDQKPRTFLGFKSWPTWWSVEYIAHDEDGPELVGCGYNVKAEAKAAFQRGSIP